MACIEKGRLVLVSCSKEIKAELALDDVEEGDLVQTGSEENSESTGREIVAFWNWDRKNYFVR